MGCCEKAPDTVCAMRMTNLFGNCEYARGAVGKVLIRIEGLLFRMPCAMSSCHGLRVHLCVWLLQVQFCAHSVL